jgi:hypothetical protein
MSGALWLVTFDSMPIIPAAERKQKQLLIRATSESDAWDQVRMRLRDTSPVLSVKPLMGDPS